MKRYFLACLILIAACRFAMGQACSPPAITTDSASNNLFTPQQEMVLGDLTVQQLSGEFRQLRNAELLAYVESIGEKMIKHLPPTGLKFKFHIIDYPVANAFNTPGGHIFITRKLIAFVNSEDELAGVIGHELGHAAVRDSTRDISNAMRKILKVSSFSSDKDVEEKFNLLIENARTKQISESRERIQSQQIDADRTGFYAMISAGYDSAAMFTFFDRLTESEGKTGSWFSELFGNTKPEQKRLREIAQATEKLPAECREGRSAKATEDFLKWQADVVMFRESGRKEIIPGLLWKKEISPKLRSDIKHFAFSSDGKLLLAQDDFSINVIDVSSRQVLFQIPAENADNAAITPDNKSVVFVTRNLRFERWDIAQKKATAARELVLRQDCWEHGLSPDGNYLACVDTATTVKIVETSTGKKLWEKKQFYPLSVFEYLTWLRSGQGDSPFEASFFRIRFSPDSRYAIFSRSNKYRFRLRVDGLTEDSSQNTAMAIDLTTMKPIDIGGNLKNIASRPYDFVDAGRIIGATEAKIGAGGLFSFPDGKRLQKLDLGGEEIKRTGDSNYVEIKPLANADAGLIDISRNAIVVGMKKKDLTIWNKMVAFESASGKILLRESVFNEATKILDGKDIGTIDLPASLIGDVETAEISDNFNWLGAVNQNSRRPVGSLYRRAQDVYARFSGRRD